MGNTNTSIINEQEELVNAFETLTPQLKTHVLTVANTLKFAQETLLYTNDIEKQGA